VTEWGKGKIDECWNNKVVRCFKSYVQLGSLSAALSLRNGLAFEVEQGEERTARNNKR